MGTSINSKSVPVLAYPTSRSFFQSLPAETRNSIYELILIHDQPIKITSLPRGRKKNAQSNSNFLALTLVNKAIGQEAKTTFYSRNTLIIGNGRYGSPIQVNLHGFRCFIRRVPKECLALIRKIHLYLFFAGFPDYRLPNSKFRMHDLDIKELKTIATAIIKHLKGVQDMLTEPRKLWKDIGPVEGLQGYARSVKLILGLPELKNIEFLDDNYRGWHEMKELVYGKGALSMDN